MSNVRLVTITPNAEAHIAYCARVSSSNQENPEYVKLIQYLIKHKHWSPFEHAFVTFEVETTRAISAQILRHRSFTFQEFSMRYSKSMDYEPFEARRQDVKNKQNSIDDMEPADREWFLEAQKETWENAYSFYNQAIARGIAKEQARALLPLNTKTKIYVTGSIRSFIHYIEVRGDVSTQLEHREIALAMKEALKKEVPKIAEALGW